MNAFDLSKGPQSAELITCTADIMSEHSTPVGGVSLQTLAEVPGFQVRIANQSEAALRQARDFYLKRLDPDADTHAIPLSNQAETQLDVANYSMRLRGVHFSYRADASPKTHDVHAAEIGGLREVASFLDNEELYGLQTATVQMLGAKGVRAEVHLDIHNSPLYSSLELVEEKVARGYHVATARLPHGSIAVGVASHSVPPDFSKKDLQAF